MFDAGIHVLFYIGLLMDVPMKQSGLYVNRWLIGFPFTYSAGGSPPAPPYTRPVIYPSSPRRFLLLNLRIQMCTNAEQAVKNLEADLWYWTTWTWTTEHHMTNNKNKTTRSSHPWCVFDLRWAFCCVESNLRYPALCPFCPYFPAADSHCRKCFFFYFYTT